MFHVIKRLADGRFWSTQSKDYIALDTVKKLMTNDNIFILDNKTKKDVTLEVLDSHVTLKPVCPVVKNAIDSKKV